MSDLSEVFCIIDTREQNKNRISAVTDFIESHGGAVEHSKLSLCDYKIEGIFREKEICIGIEAKSLTDFSSSYQDLPDKLARSFELYNDVCLFVEVPQFKTSSADGFHATIVNPSVPDGSANVLQYAVLQNSLASWQQSGVHVRQLQSELFWPYAIASVLITVTKDTHRGLEISKVKDYRSQYLNILSKFEGIGQKTALKIIKHYPNMYWLSTAHIDNLKENLGKVTGAKISKFLTNNELYTAEWMAGNTEPCEIQPKTSDDSNKGLPLNERTQGKGNIPNNPELKYLDDNKPKFIEVPKGCYVNGGEIRDINLQRDQEPEVLQSSSAVTDGSHTHKDASSSNIPATGTPDNLQQPPTNSEFSANPRLKDIIEYIRKHPRTTSDIGKEFGLSPEYCLKALYALKDEHKKVWFEKATLTWNFGLDRNPVLITADKEIDIGIKGDE